MSHRPTAGQRYTKTAVSSAGRGFRKVLSILRTIGSANFKTPIDNKGVRIDRPQRKTAFVRKICGDNSFYVPVTFEFDNKGDIIPGSFVEPICCPHGWRTLFHFHVPH